MIVREGQREQCTDCNSRSLGTAIALLRTARWTHSGVLYLWQDPGGDSEALHLSQHLQDIHLLAGPPEAGAGTGAGAGVHLLLQGHGLGVTVLLQPCICFPSLVVLSSSFQLLGDSFLNWRDSGQLSCTSMEYLLYKMKKIHFHTQKPDGYRWLSPPLIITFSTKFCQFFSRDHKLCLCLMLTEYKKFILFSVAYLKIHISIISPLPNRKKALYALL